MQTSWEPEHSQALRDYLAKGLSYAEIARAINATFHTAYSRNAAIGRARRMGLAGARSVRRVRPAEIATQAAPAAVSQDAQTYRGQIPAGRGRFSKRAAALQLRCVGIVPRHLSLLELEAGDCRYPFGGDAEGEAITFCGHPRREGSSYCVSHFHLTRGIGSASERSAVQRPAAAGGGGMTRMATLDRRHDRQDEAVAAASSHRASARADRACAGRFDPPRRTGRVVARAVDAAPRQRKPRAMNRPWMPLYVGDYLGDTGHLTTTQHGAYLLLMMHYWRKGELPDDDRQLSKITKLPLKTWCDYRATLQDFFHDGLEAQADRRRTGEDGARVRKARDRRAEGRPRLGAGAHEAGKCVAFPAALVREAAASNCRAIVEPLPRQPSTTHTHTHIRVFQGDGSPGETSCRSLTTAFRRTA